MNYTASFQQFVRRRLEIGAPCSLNPDEIAAVHALFKERDRLEREKIALAQDVLNGRDRQIAQAEALDEAADDCVPAMHQMANWLRARAHEKRCQAKGGD
ncbi:hypothetical protein FIU83_06265 [Halomonas sp. THAF5a]|uniref:hypothetical protein n=1 Tax=Halomonas sp. THAF5a TaxID=2587844 RepID=UPI001269829D|nr:hypothetical protein [Halomonas sp. THAF5a]QFU01239.1 hypothetical protein FIU83_06265 [Halomonas sp. THAF5a]